MNQHTVLGGVPGFLARPAGKGPWPALIVIHEWWGLDAQTESIAQRFAGEGYLAFAPDLYHGDLAPLGDNEKAMAYLKVHGNQAPADLASVWDALKALPEASGKVGSVGFCFGGRMSLSLGLQRPVDAVCTFYGGQMQMLFDKMGGWNIPVLGLFGDADVSIPKGTVEQFQSLLAGRGVEHEVVTYPDSGHAFFRDSDPSVYRPVAAADAWNRTQAFFGRHLKPQSA
jgi:carboxymethylenebutenolidase